MYITSHVVVEASKLCVCGCRHFVVVIVGNIVIMANLPNRYSALCRRPVTHAQTWASYSALYRFGRLSVIITVKAVNDKSE